MLVAYVTYCIRLPIGLALALVALVAVRTMWYSGYLKPLRYRLLLRKRARKNGTKSASGLGPKS